MSDPTRNRNHSRTLCEFRVIARFALFLILTVALVALAQTTVAERMPVFRSAAGDVASRAQKRRPQAGGNEAYPGRVARSHGTRVGPDEMAPEPPLFLPPVTYSIGSNGLNFGSTVAIADVNGDGKQDVIVSNQHGGSNGDGAVLVLLGKGDGSLQSAVSYDVGSSPVSVTVADLNGDHKVDLVVANCGLVGGTGCEVGGFVSVLLGNGDGTFRTFVPYNSGGFGALAVAVGDANADNKPDLIVANNTADGFTGEGNVAVLLGNGDGSFSAPVTYDSGGQSANSVVLTDMNGDGKPDVLVSNQCAIPNNGCASKGLVGVLLGNGDGTFSPVIGYDAGGYTSTSITVEDVNGDSKPDVIVSSGCDAIGNACEGAVVGVLLGNGDGTFQPSVVYFSGGPGGSNGSVAAVDVNGDSRPDLLVTNSGFGTMGILLGNGDGTFRSAVTFDSGGSSPGSVAVADLSGDGLPDIAVSECAVSGCGNANLVGVLLHVGPKPTHTTIVSSLNPSIFGQPVTFTSTVSSGSGTPTGIVAFFDGATAIGSATLVSASASISISGLAVGSHSISAIYQGSVKFKSSGSTPVHQVVNGATTSTSLAPSRNPMLVTASVTYTATVTSQYGGTVTGAVTFFDSGAPFATVNVLGKQASYRKKYNSIGVHSITATYSGDANNGGSASGTLTEYVQATTNTALTTSGTPSHSGQPVTFTASVTSKHGAVPNGELVKFYDSSKLLSSVALAGGTAAYTTSTLSVATHTIKAKYAGDTFFTKSTGKVTQIVEP
jgi:hypothetical protein